MNVNNIAKIVPSDTKFRKLIKKVPINKMTYTVGELSDWSGHIGMCIPKGFIAIDIDDNNIADTVSLWLEESGLKCIQTKTPKGRHFIFKTGGKKFKNNVKARTIIHHTLLDLEIDVRAEARNERQAGYVCLPDNYPGREYVSVPDTVDVIPSWLTPINMKQSDAYDMSGSEGSRNDNMYKYILFMRDNLMHFTSDDIVNAANFINSKWESPLSASEMQSLLSDKNIARDVTKKGNAEREIAIRILEEHQIKKSKGLLYIFDGHIYRECDEEYIRWLVATEYNDTLKMAKRREVYYYIYDNLEDIIEDNNANKFLVATPSTIINLEDMTTEVNDGNTFITSGIRWEYEPDITSEFCEKYMIDMFGDNVDMVYDMIGYSFMRTLKFRHSFWFIGPKGTGKSVFIDDILRQLYTTVSDVSVSDLSSNAFAGEYISKSLVNIVDDVSLRTLKDANKFKSAVSGNTIDSDRKNKTRLSFKPIATWVLNGNDMPIFAEKDDSIYSRIVIIPVDKKIKTDPFFTDKLDDDFFKYLVMRGIKAGFEIIKRGGLKITTDRLVNDFKVSNDNVLEFSNEVCPIEYGCRDYYRMYKEWCLDYGYYVLNLKQFEFQMSKGYKKYQSSVKEGRVMMWKKK